MNLLGHARLNALEHGAAAGKHDVSEEVPADVLVALHDGVVGVLVDTVLAKVLLKRWHEKKFWALQSLLSDLDPVAAW